MDKRVSYKLNKFGSPLEKEVSEIPTPQDDQVLVKVTFCGICHSDLHMQDGYFDTGDGSKLDVSTTAPLPIIMGHEVVGVIEKLGKDAQASGRKVGEKVAIYPIDECGDCHHCTSGNGNYCSDSTFVGNSAEGGFSTHIIIKQKLAIPYSTVEGPFAAMCCCSGITTYSAIKKIGNISNDDEVLFIGAGGLGLMALELFKIVYPNKKMPVVADIDDSKLKIALKNGASEVYNLKTQKKELSPKLKLSWIGQGYAAVLDFVGSGETVTFGTGLLNKGGKYVIVGLFGGKASISTPPMTLKGTQIIGNYLGSLQEFKELMKIISSGKVTPPPFAVCPLHQVNNALTNLREGKVVGRSVLKMDQSASL